MVFSIVHVCLKMEQWYKAITARTEQFLTWRKRRKFKKKEKQKQKNPVLDWIEAFLWAAGVVLLINQYLFQAYQIPSGSMKNTLKIQDRIFVNKLIYGPELLPGKYKLPGFREPQRSEVIIFESPTYISKGPAFDILQRVLYMVTLSIVDIDRDEQGRPRAHFLIKRAVGTEGDRIRFVRGEVEFILPGRKDWQQERDTNILHTENYTIRRMVEPQEYTGIIDSAIGDAYEQAGIPLSTELKNALENSNNRYLDVFAWSKARLKTLYTIHPQERHYGSNWRKAEIGWYIPEGWIFPLGDNRDNSRDARYFGPVQKQNVLGKAMFIYWPPERIGIIR